MANERQVSFLHIRQGSQEQNVTHYLADDQRIPADPKQLPRRRWRILRGCQQQESGPAALHLTHEHRRIPEAQLHRTAALERQRQTAACSAKTRWGQRLGNVAKYTRAYSLLVIVVAGRHSCQK